MNAVELALGSYTQRGKVATLEQVRHPSFIRRYYKTPHWISYYTFDAEELKGYIAKRVERGESPSLDSDYPHRFGLDRIWLDFDVDRSGGGGLIEARMAVADVVRHLMEKLYVQPTWIQVWFSGMKGFHIELPNLFGLEPSENLPAVLKASVESMLGGPYLDTQLMLPAGMVRAPWSRHNKVGLHKIPLTIEELETLEISTIQQYASDPPKYRKGFVLAPMDNVQAVWKDRVTNKPKNIYFGTSKSGIQVDHDPTTVVTCVQKIWARGPIEGFRHRDVLPIISWLWRGGIPEDAAVAMILHWIQPKDKTEEKEFTHHVRSTYRRRYLYGCDHPLLKEYCDPKCIFFQKKDWTVNVQTAQSLAQRYKSFLDKVHKKGLGFDLKELYPHMTRSYRILPGDVLIVTGDTGMGKSGLVQNWLQQIGQEAAYLNLEMSEQLAFRRQIQIAHNMTKMEVERFFMTRTEEEIQELLEKIDHIKFRSVAPRLEEIEHLVMQLDPNLVVIDTTDAIEVPGAGNNEMYALKKIVEEMRRIAQTHQKIVIGLHHIHKAASKAISGEDGSGMKRPLSLNDLTGNRANVTKMDHVFAVTGERGSIFRDLVSLKTRDDEQFKVTLHVDWNTFRFSAPIFDQDPF